MLKASAGDASRNATGRLFQTRGPATAKDLSFLFVASSRHFPAERSDGFATPAIASRQSHDKIRIEKHGLRCQEKFSF